MAGERRIVVPFDGHSIGEGISSGTLERIGRAVQATTEGEDPNSDGQTAEFKFRMITSQQSLEEELKIDAKVDARYGLFSGSARFQFAESNSINTKSTFILASCVVRNSLRFGKDFLPTTAAAPLIAAGDRTAFENAFGTRFVQALRTGGELYVLVKVTSSNIKHQTDIAASLHAAYNGLAAAVDFQGAFQTAKNDTSSFTKVDIIHRQVGGQGLQLQFNGADADKIKAQMNQFAQFVHDHAVAYEAELLTYDALALPFPSSDELADKRTTLEDCLRQKQRLWSILSDLRLAQSEDGPRYFADLPPAQDLEALAARFARILSDLMAHARAVANGTVEPTFFVATDNPPPPMLKRRSSTNFARWWLRRNDPDLLADERTIVFRVGDAAQQLLDDVFIGDPDLDDAQKATVAAAAERASTIVESIDLVQAELATLERLPTILDAPLQRLSAGINELENLRGVDQYPRLENLGCNRNRIDDLTAITGLGGLRLLSVIDNEIVDLGPIAALKNLQTLHIGGNEIASLEPLRTLDKLDNLALANGHPEQTSNGVVVRPFKFLDNPIDDATAVDDLPLLANVTTKASRMTVSFVAIDGDALRMSGQATRLESSNRFDLVPAEGGPPVRLIQATFLHITRPGRDLVMVSLFVPSLNEVAVALADPGGDGATLSIAECKAVLAEGDGAEHVSGFLVGQSTTMVFEATAIS